MATQTKSKNGATRKTLNMEAVKPPEPKHIVIPRLDLKMLPIKIIGDSPLIMHRFSEKALRQIEEKQAKKAKGAKEARSPEAEFESARYINADGDDYIPGAMMKHTAVSACSFVDGITKVSARGAFHIVEDEIKIIGAPPIMRTDTVKIAMGTLDLRYRPEYTKWAAEFVVRFNAAVMSDEQIINLYNVAGFSIGIGEWRPGRNGSFGMFHVALNGE